MPAFFVKYNALLKAIVWELRLRFLVLFSVFVRWKVTFNENVSFTDHTYRVRLLDCSKFTLNQKNDNSVKICWHDVIVKFFWCCHVSLVKISYWSKFMSISLLVLEIWQFPFMKDWPGIGKSVILPSTFCPLSGDWGKLGMPNLARMSLIKCYWMLKNTPFLLFRHSYKSSISLLFFTSSIFY